MKFGKRQKIKNRVTKNTDMVKIQRKTKIRKEKSIFLPHSIHASKMRLSLHILFYFFNFLWYLT